MNWIFFALLAPATLTITNFIDKYIVGNVVKDYRGVVIMQAIVGFIVGTFFWIITGFPILTAFDAGIVLTTGIITTWAAALYFKALKEEDTSYVIFMFQLIPVFVILLSVIFLGETFSAKQLIGFAIILFCSLAISLQKGKKIFHLSRSFWLLFIMDLLFAGTTILIKFALNATSFSQILSYESWGIGIGGVVLYVVFPTIRNAFNEIVTTVGKKVLGIMFLNEGIYVVSKSLTYFAYAIGPVALVSVLASTQTFYGIVTGVLLTLLLPHIFKENIEKGELIKKVGLAILLILGILLLY